MFGGLLASAIANMEGVRGKSSWRWIFILEGLATIVIGFAAYFLVADFPADAKWLTEEERDWVMTRTRSEERLEQSVNGKAIIRFFSDGRNILAGIMYFCKFRARPNKWSSRLTLLSNCRPNLLSVFSACSH